MCVKAVSREVSNPRILLVKLLFTRKDQKDRGTMDVFSPWFRTKKLSRKLTQRRWEPEEPEGSGSPVYHDLTQGKLGAEVKVEVVITDKLRRAYCLSRTQPSA